MSEDQYLYFAAVDRALDDKQLAYMRRQRRPARYHFSDSRKNMKSASRFRRNSIWQENGGRKMSVCYLPAPIFLPASFLELLIVAARPESAACHSMDQSTRAEVTRWQFENEYHYGSFGGNTVEMMRRGYDVHLHYANFSIVN